MTRSTPLESIVGLQRISLVLLSKQASLRHGGCSPAVGGVTSCRTTFLRIPPDDQFGSCDPYRNEDDEVDATFPFYIPGITHRARCLEIPQHDTHYPVDDEGHDDESTHSRYRRLTHRLSNGAPSKTICSHGSRRQHSHSPHRVSLNKCSPQHLLHLGDEVPQRAPSLRRQSSCRSEQLFRDRSPSRIDRRRQSLSSPRFDLNCSRQDRKFDNRQQQGVPTKQRQSRVRSEQLLRDRPLPLPPLMNGRRRSLSPPRVGLKYGHQRPRINDEQLQRAPALQRQSSVRSVRSEQRPRGRSPSRMNRRRHSLSPPRFNLNCSRHPHKTTDEQPQGALALQRQSSIRSEQLLRGRSPSQIDSRRRHSLSPPRFDLNCSHQRRRITDEQPQRTPALQRQSSVRSVRSEQLPRDRSPSRTSRRRYLTEQRRKYSSTSRLDSAFGRCETSRQHRLLPSDLRDIHDDLDMINRKQRRLCQEQSRAFIELRMMNLEHDLEALEENQQQRYKGRSSSCYYEPNVSARDRSKQHY